MMDEKNYYAAPEAQLAERSDPIGMGGDVQLASVGQRLGAYLADMGFYVLCYLPFVVLMGVGEDAMIDISLVLMAAAMLGLMGVNLWLLYKNGQTLGKRVLGIKIVRGDLRSRASLLRIAFVRYLPVWVIGQIPCLGALVILVNYLLIFRDDRRCGHDHIADTHVVVDDGIVGTEEIPAQAPTGGRLESSTVDTAPTQVDWEQNSFGEVSAPGASDGGEVSGDDNDDDPTPVW